MFTNHVILLFISFSFYEKIKPCEIDEFKSIWNENYNKLKNDKPPTRTEEFSNYNQTDCEDVGIFDFIIVGAGTAGTIVANRLSENPNWKILLLEAGGEESKLASIPGAYDKISSDYLWPYKTIKQKRACFDRKTRRCWYKKGKSLGGTSSMNTVYARGSPSDYDKWDRTNNIDWSYNSSLTYFKKLEKASGFLLDTDYHGYKGEVVISKSDYHHPLFEILTKVNHELGSNPVDYNGKSQMGFSKLQLLVDYGKKKSNNQIFLEPMSDKRSNLFIMKRALATKLEFQKEAAYRIKFLHNNICKYATVKNEFILSAGVINTPQILQLSGIGPKNLLESFKINMVADLGVGQNFQDSVCFGTGVPIHTNFTFDIKSTDQIISSYLGGTGPLSTPSDVGISYHNVNANTTNVNKPDFALMYGFDELNILRNFHNSSHLETQSVITIKPELLYPKSKGTVYIKSTDPLEFPDINPKLLEEQADFQTMLYATKLLLKYSESETFKTIDGFIKTDIFSKCMTKGLKGKKLWVCVIKENAIPCMSGFGSCRFGSSPSNSVVDPELKVHGIGKLRIVDASVIPKSVGSKISAAVMMIAERISEHIKKVYS